MLELATFSKKMVRKMMTASETVSGTMSIAWRNMEGAPADAAAWQGSHAKATSAAAWALGRGRMNIKMSGFHTLTG